VTGRSSVIKNLGTSPQSGSASLTIPTLYLWQRGLELIARGLSVRGVPVFLRAASGRPECISPFQGEADLERNLVVADLAVLDVPPRLNDFKPIHISDCLVRFRYGGRNGVLDARFG
jgi:hypothetical protein